MKEYDSQAAARSAFIFFTVAESVLEGSNGWKQRRRRKKVTLRVTVWGERKKKTDPTWTTIST